MIAVQHPASANSGYALRVTSRVAINARFFLRVIQPSIKQLATRVPLR
jgi:hypothetical protein